MVSSVGRWSWGIQESKLSMPWSKPERSTPAWSKHQPLPCLVPALNSLSGGLWCRPVSREALPMLVLVTVFYQSNIDLRHTCLCPTLAVGSQTHCHTWLLAWALGVQAQNRMLVWQVLHCLGHLLSLRTAHPGLFTNSELIVKGSYFLSSH